MCMKRIFLFVLLVVSNIIVVKAQNGVFSYQIQYNLIDVEYTNGDSLYETVCMLDLDNVSNSVQQIEINVGTVQGASDIRTVTIPFNNGAQLVLFNNNKKGMARIGNLPATNASPYYYSVRLKYNDGTYSSLIETNSIAN